MNILVRSIARTLFSERTKTAVKFDLLRLRTRMFGTRGIQIPRSPRMHLGSGYRRLAGWVNVDMMGADINIDMTARPFPFQDNVFEAVVSQHLIEHLDFESEVLPVFREVFRVLKPGGELWLSTPDMAKICHQYMADGGATLHKYILERDPRSLPQDALPSFAVNTMFFQRGLHKNLLDFALLEWILKKCGFAAITRVTENDLLARFPDFPPRNDDFEALSIRCNKPVISPTP